MHRSFAAVVLCLIPTAARGDVILMNDGRRFEGKIMSETAHDVVIDTVVNKIRLKMTLARVQVVSITREAVPDNFFDSPSPTRAPSAPSAPARNEPPPAPNLTAIVSPGAYVEIPLVGKFGEDIYPKGVEAALDEAVAQGVKHAVIRIKSGGGEVWAAQGIAEVLARFQGRITTHALIEQALSASIWVVFSCDTIDVVPGATLGAAVVYTRDKSTGAAEVDSKMNSALAAELGASAERRGRSAAVVRAMMIPGAELYAWKDRAGKVTISGEHPPSPEPQDLRVLSGRSDVLTLTSDEAVWLGLAGRLTSPNPAAIGPSRGIAEWTADGGSAAPTMEKYAKACTKFRVEFDEASASLVSLATEARSLDPRKFNYQVDAKSGDMTDDSRRRWTELSDRAIRAWTKAKETVATLTQLQAKSEELGLTPYAQSRTDAEEVKRIVREVDVKIADLRKDRSRRKLPAEFDIRK